MIEIVLFAVATSQRPVRIETPSCADFLPLNIFEILSRSHLIPPYCFVSSAIPPMNIERRNTSIIPWKPVQIFCARLRIVRSP